MPDRALSRTGAFVGTRIRRNRSENIFQRIPFRIGTHIHTGSIAIVQGNRGVVLPSKISQTGPMHHTNFNCYNSDGIPVRLSSCDCRVANNTATACSIYNINWLTQLFLQ